MKVVQKLTSQKINSGENWNGPCSSKAANRVRNLDYRIKQEKLKSERSEICPLLAKSDTTLDLGGFEHQWLRMYDEECAIFVPSGFIHLKKNIILLADGTFKSSSNMFQQHYIILNVETMNNEEQYSVLAEVIFLTYSKTSLLGKISISKILYRFL